MPLARKAHLLIRPLLILVAAALALALAPSAAGALELSEYQLPAASSPWYLAPGPDGALWATGSGVVIRMTTHADASEYAVESGSRSVLSGITAGPDGQMWFEDRYNGLLFRMAPGSGSMTSTTIGTPASTAPEDIAAGPDGALWMTDWKTNSIWRSTTSFGLISYSLPSGSSPTDIVAGPDGALWFTESGTNKIGRISTAGVLTEYAIPTASSGPGGIAVGPDGALWFTEGSANKIGRIAPSDDSFLEYPIPTASSDPDKITAGSDGALWFTELQGNKIARITTAGTIVEYALPSASSEPVGIVTASDGAVWFAEQGGDRLGRIGGPIETAAPGGYDGSGAPPAAGGTPPPGGGGPSTGTPVHTNPVTLLPTPVTRCHLAGHAPRPRGLWCAVHGLRRGSSVQLTLTRGRKSFGAGSVRNARQDAAVPVHLSRRLRAGTYRVTVSVRLRAQSLRVSLDLLIP